MERPFHLSTVIKVLVFVQCTMRRLSSSVVPCTKLLRIWYRVIKDASVSIFNRYFKPNSMYTEPLKMALYISYCVDFGQHLKNYSLRLTKICSVIYLLGSFKIRPSAHNPEEFELLNLRIVQCTQTDLCCSVLYMKVDRSKWVGETD